MRTTVTLDETLVERAMELTGRTEKSALVRDGLEALIERESARRLALLGGSDPKATSAPRRRNLPAE
ncbi:type II toxin-antitoxin system VapB family antitoxin [Saxibacter everestensis]|uniref:Type II toxin-antitoxin system VapB family antitoxin n=1 Tax=Saxibacter everestensis TaxID=2909229 RepID=A0ABY8QNU7_9MICO|nr:type II toxin-antitoxin system VapB family antitoxin [Brevibacteriaceae bacterium ZFBP1038]